MKSEINLLKVASVSEKELILKKLARMGTVLLILVYILAGAGVFIGFFSFSKQEEKLATEISRKEKTIKALAKTEFLQLAVADRLKIISEVLGKEKDKMGLVSSLNRLEALAGSEIKVSSFDIDDYGNSAVLRGSSGNVIELADFFSRIMDDKNEKWGVSSFSVSNLKRGLGGSYEFNLELKFLRQG